MNNTIGSSKNSDVVLNGKHISECHAILTEYEDRVFIEDLNSTFGTIVNGVSIKQKTELFENDRVKLGTLLFNWKDHLSTTIIKEETNPIYVKDLFDPRGIVNWQDYKYILLIFLGLLIVIPFGAPVVIIYLNTTYLNSKVAMSEVIDISEVLIVLLGLILMYVFLNLTLKSIRGLIASKR